MNKVKKSIFAMTMVVAMICLGASPVNAASEQNQDIWGVLKKLTNKSTSASTSVLADLANATLDKAGIMKWELKLSELGVQISSKSDEAVKIQSKLGGLSVKMPFSSTASNGREISNGIIAFDNKNGSASVPIIKSDGSLQMTTVIQSAAAPTRYTYQFQTDSDLKILKYRGGLILLKNSKFAGAVAPAWAKDASGKDVPTHYEVDGSEITQVVEHPSAEYEYPIVADPWLGTNLFSSVYLASWTYSAQPVVNLNLSTWGWLVYSGVAQGGLPLSFGAGQAILDTAGWDEAWGKGGAIRAALDKPSQRQQFSCHALGAIAAGEWNLEKGRPNRLNGNWGAGVAIHHCNWKYAEGSQTD